MLLVFVIVLVVVVVVVVVVVEISPFWKWIKCCEPTHQRHISKNG